MREELREKYENAAWDDATKLVDMLIEMGKKEKAIQSAKEAIKNWQEEDGKEEIVENFKSWLKERGLEL